VPVFRECSRCGTRWMFMVRHSYSSTPDSGVDFCTMCGEPGPWLTRRDLLAWIKNLLRASPELDPEDRPKLIGMPDGLDALDPDDTKTVEAWQRLRSAAPKVWEMTKPVRDALIGEAVKRILGL